MPLDAVCLQAVVAELAPQITGSRIEKIQQPARDQVVLLLRGNRRLLLSAGGGQPRLHLTELQHHLIPGGLLDLLNTAAGDLGRQLRHHSQMCIRDR